jgi:hypothetical protein
LECPPPHILMSVMVDRKSRYAFLMKRALPASSLNGNWYCPRLSKTPNKVRSRSWKIWIVWGAKGTIHTRTSERRSIMTGVRWTEVRWTIIHQ